MENISLGDDFDFKDEEMEEVEGKRSNDVELIPEDSGFISDTGEIVVMDDDGDTENFKLKYVDIMDIAIPNRIRLTTVVDDLIKSIKSTGLLSPVIVAPTATEGNYVLLDGYRRLLACAKSGKRNIPCIINNKVNTPEIPILEALYNHNKAYSIEEIRKYIDYLEKQKGIMSGSMIEYLLQMNSGDYTKLKDLLDDGDEEILEKLYGGQLTIEQAFKKLEMRRKKESQDEKDIRRAEKVYENEQKSGADDIAGSGEEADGISLSDEEIKDLVLDPRSLDEGLEDASLNEMLDEGKQIDGYESKKQSVDNRERIDPTIRREVFIRDNYTCQCCKEGGGSYVDVLEAHHIIPVFLNGGLSAEVAGDTMENIICVCIKCHRQIHLYSTNELVIPKEKSKEEIEKLDSEERVLYNNEQMKFKRIVKLGTIIRNGIARKGIKIEQYKKDNPSRSIGRTNPGFRNGVSPEEADIAYKNQKKEA